MELHTKYDPGQELWYIDSNMLCHGTVESVFARGGRRAATSYVLAGQPCTRPENTLHPTKQDLLDALSKQAG